MVWPPFCAWVWSKAPSSTLWSSGARPNFCHLARLGCCISMAAALLGGGAPLMRRMMAAMSPVSSTGPQTMKSGTAGDTRSPTVVRAVADLLVQGSSRRPACSA